MQLENVYCPADGCGTVLFTTPKPFWLRILESFVCTKCFVRVAPIGMVIRDQEPSILKIQFHCHQCGEIFSQEIQEVKETCTSCGQSASIFLYHDLKIRYSDHYAAAFKWTKECRKKENA